MSQFYDLASLVVIPSGYKASTIYAQKPLTTDGQLSFSRASTATRVNSSGLIEAVSSNVPRLDYLGSTCPRLLLEPQRTNLVTFSESFDNAAWAKSACSITANNVVSPDGYTNADLVTSSGAAGYIYPGNTNIFGSAGGATYAYSVYAKAGTASTITILVGAAATYTGVFNLSAGTATTSTANTTVSIVSAGNGWYRCVIICASVSNQVYSELQIGRVANGLTFYLYGAQLEAGAYSTSYIPTPGASSVTRVADAASKTGISSLIGQTEGTIFAEFQYYDNIAVGSSQYISPITISNGGYTNAVYMEIFNDSLIGIVFNGGALQSAITLPNLTSGTHKVALAYNANDIAFYVDGVLIGTDTNATIPSVMSQLNLCTVGGSTNLDQAYTQTQALLFKTRLTNAQLAELTTL